MARALPFCREAGSGPLVLSLHANASSSGQWRGLLELLAPRFRVVAPDSYDSGRGPHWPSERLITLAEEATLVEPILAEAPSPAVVVGHSYGAAVALVAALRNPGRVRALVLYEPTLFSLIDAEGPAPNDADGIRNAVAAAAVELDAGNADGAAERFIDYWMGEGTWKRMPAERKPPIAASVKNVRRWAHALFQEPTPLAAFRALDLPVLYLVGERTTASARGVARLLAPALPQAQVVHLERLGHMGPVTHPEIVNEKIAAFLDSLSIE